jgi:hypothetical protein
MIKQHFPKKLTIRIKHKLFHKSFFLARRMSKYRFLEETTSSNAEAAKSKKTSYAAVTKKHGGSGPSSPNTGAPAAASASGKATSLNANATEFTFNPSTVEFVPQDDAEYYDYDAAEYYEDPTELYDGDGNVPYDAFFPDYQKCTCCHGMVFSCSGDICSTLDSCVCTYDPAFQGPLSRTTDAEIPVGADVEYSEATNELASKLESKVSFEPSDDMYANRLPDEEKNKDTWIPAKSKCICCKGFIYNCNKEGCESASDVCACYES